MSLCPMVLVSKRNIGNKENKMPIINLKSGLTLQEIEDAGFVTSPVAQVDVENLVDDLASKVSNADFEAMMAVMDFQNSVIGPVHYHKATPPTGVAATNTQLCICDDGKLYTFTGGAWNAGVAMNDGDRYWHFSTGTDVSGDSGEHSASPYFKIYEWDEVDNVLLGASSTFGTCCAVLSFSRYMWFNGAVVDDFISTQLSANEVLAIQAANLGALDVVAKTSDIPFQSKIDIGSFVASGNRYWRYSKDANSRNNSSYTFSGETLAAGAEIKTQFWANIGVYEFCFSCTVNADLGKMRIFIDNVEYGSIDTYNPAWYPFIPMSTFATILTNGMHELKVVVTKNASSSGYSIVLSDLFLKKIVNGYSFMWMHGQSTTLPSMKNSIVSAGAITRNTNAGIWPSGEYFYVFPFGASTETKSPDLYLPAGNYSLYCSATKDNYSGIMELYENNTLVHTEDNYSGPTILNYAVNTTFTIEANRASNIRLKANGKNASSSNYAIEAQMFRITKTS